MAEDRATIRDMLNEERRIGSPVKIPGIATGFRQAAVTPPPEPVVSPVMTSGAEEETRLFRQLNPGAVPPETRPQPIFTRGAESEAQLYRQLNPPVTTTAGFRQPVAEQQTTAPRVYTPEQDPRTQMFSDLPGAIRTAEMPEDLKAGAAALGAHRDLLFRRLSAAPTEGSRQRIAEELNVAEEYLYDVISKGAESKYASQLATPAIRESVGEFVDFGVAERTPGRTFEQQAGMPAREFVPKSVREAEERARRQKDQIEQRGFRARDAGEMALEPTIGGMGEVGGLPKLPEFREYSSGISYTPEEEQLRAQAVAEYNRSLATAYAAQLGFGGDVAAGRLGLQGRLGAARIGAEATEESARIRAEQLAEQRAAGMRKQMLPMDIPTGLDVYGQPTTRPGFYDVQAGQVVDPLAGGVRRGADLQSKFAALPEDTKNVVRKYFAGREDITPEDISEYIDRLSR